MSGEGIITSFTLEEGGTFQGQLLVDGQETVPETGKKYEGEISLKTSNDHLLQDSVSFSESQQQPGSVTQEASGQQNPLLVGILVVILLAAAVLYYKRRKK